MEYKYNCILDTRCPGRRLQKELTFKWTDEYQEKNNTFYHNTNSSIFQQLKRMMRYVLLI